MTIYIKDTKVGRIVPGKLDCDVDDFDDIYSHDSAEYDAAYAAYDAAGDVQREIRKDHILATFRKVVAEHKMAFPEEVVTKCYLNYRDAEFLYQAYRAEQGLFDKHVCGCDSDFVCDNIQIKKGCDNGHSKITIHSYPEDYAEAQEV